MQPPTVGHQADITARNTLPPGSRYEISRYELNGVWYGTLCVPGKPALLAGSAADEVSLVAKLRTLYLEANP